MFVHNSTNMNFATGVITSINHITKSDNSHFLQHKRSNSLPIYHTICLLQTDEIF